MADLERWGPDYHGLAHAPDRSAAGLSRRRFLQLSALGVGTTMVLPSWMADMAAAATPLGPAEGVLVVVMMGGGNDGLDTVVPHGDSNYYRLRSHGTAWQPGETLALAPGVGLHPDLPGIKARWDAGDVAVVRGVGNPGGNLSHFDSMASWMRAHPNASTNTGWLGRYLDGLGADPLRGVTIGTSIPLHLVGAATRATGLPESINDAFGANRADRWRNLEIDAVSAFAAQSTGLGPWADSLARSGRETVALGAQLGPAYSTSLPNGELARQLTLAAGLVNANLGIRVLNVSYGDFDHHDDLRARHAERMSEFDAGVSAFFATLNPSWSERVTLMTFSEFGRRPADNDSGGTDHGTASSLFVIGSKVRGGLYGQQPGMRDADLDNDDCLRTTVDFRSVYATLLDRWLDADSHQILGASYEDLAFVDPPGATAAGGGGGATPIPPAVGNGSTVGYRLLDRSGQVHSFGTASDLGSPDGIGDAAAMAPTPNRGGYWVASASGSVYAYGNAPFHGGLGGVALNAPIVGMAATPSGGGYWLLGRDGGIFSFGDATFHGSTGSMALNAPVVSMAATPTGGGYWFVASDGGIFAFGDARFHGSMGGSALNSPVVAMAPTASGQGYWLVAADGGVFAYGDAAFHGSTGSMRLNRPVVAVAVTPTGAGYWFVADDGGIFAFGDAGFAGSLGGSPPAGGVVGMSC